MKRLVAGWMLIGCGGVMGADAPTSPWELTSAAALSLADGNTESEAWSLQMLATYAGDPYEAALGMDYFYSSSDGVRSSDSIKLHEQVSRSLGGPWYVSQYGAGLKDEVADLDYRVDVSGLLGYRVFRNERGRLSLEAGPGFAWESQAGEQDEFATLRVAQRYEYLLSDNVRLWQSFGWTPRVDDFSDGVIEFDAGIETRINSHFALRTFLRHRIDQSPATGSGKEDTALMVGLSYDHDGVKAPKLTTAAGRKSLFKGSGSGGAVSPEGWEHSAAAGVTVNQGNADKMATTLSWDSEYHADQREFTTEVDYLFADENGETSADRLSARAQYNRHLDSPAYLGVAMSFLRDDLADIGYRVTPGVLAGYALIQEPSTKLVLEGGPTVTFEEVAGDGSQYASVMAAQRLKHRFNGRQVLRQSVVGTAEAGNLENYKLAATVSLDTELSGRWIWRVSGECHYENLPAAGREHRDLLLTSSVAVKF